MPATIDLTEGVWRFHQVYGPLSQDAFRQRPVGVDGTSTAVLLTFTKQAEPLAATREGWC